MASAGLVVGGKPFANRKHRHVSILVTNRMHFTDHDLIAYLLGDASAGLAQRIVLQLAHDHSLRERCEQLRVVLGHLDSLDCNYEPPANLVEATMDRIAAEEQMPEAHDAETQAMDERDANEAPAPAGGERGVVELAAILSNALETPRHRRSPWDSTALTLSLTVLCCLALPALVGARFEARKLGCADNLRRMGEDSLNYAQNDPQGRYPRVPLEGPMAFAGFYAVELNQAGYLQSPLQLLCPSMRPQRQAVIAAESSPQTQFVGGALPTAEQLELLPPTQLRASQAAMGGDYASGLGVLEGKHPVAPRNEGRSNFAILADAPMIEGGVESFIAHDGHGINILFDDGHVRFVRLGKLKEGQSDTGSEMSLRGDHPLRNDRGQHQLGLHKEDASLAPSHFSPLGVTEPRND